MRRSTAFGSSRAPSATSWPTARSISTTRRSELFDYVVASVHTVFGQPREEMTARIVKAVRHPLVHDAGSFDRPAAVAREGYAVDLDAVLHAAAESGTMIEINAQPSRLDLDWIHCKKAKAMGIKLVINPDAHSTGELELFTYGVDVARRGWLEKGDVFNTQSLRQIERALGVSRCERRRPADGGAVPRRTCGPGRSARARSARGSSRPRRSTTEPPSKT